MRDGLIPVICGGILLAAIGCAPQDSAQQGDPPVPPAGALDAPAVDVEAPAEFQAKFETSTGDFVIKVHREWAPRGADRFYSLVKSGFFDGCRFFRVVPGFMVQFGINGDPATQARWREQPIPDDPPTKSNRRGYVTFATAGPNTRTTQIFINYGDNNFLDSQGFAPFGEVVEGMETVDDINSEYREMPNQGMIQGSGNEYLNRTFPNLDYVKKATIIGEEAAAAPAEEAPAPAPADAPGTTTGSDATTPGDPEPSKSDTEPDDSSPEDPAKPEPNEEKPGTDSPDAAKPEADEDTASPEEANSEDPQNTP